MRALALIQPWAWLIVNGHKDIENRTWATSYTGPLLIHASKNIKVAREEYDLVKCLIEDGDVISVRGVEIILPPFEEIQLAGIVGVCDVTGCVTESDSCWFNGPYGFKVANARPLPFVPFKGSQGFFDVPAGLMEL